MYTHITLNILLFLYILQMELIKDQTVKEVQCFEMYFNLIKPASWQ